MMPNPCKRNRAIPGEQTPRDCRALYVHVPFCRAKCRYCDFHSDPIANCPDALDRYVEAIARELTSNADCLCAPLRSIFIGGGTPTALGPRRLRELLETLRPLAGPDTEFSVEANPGTVDGEIVSALSDSGVNRVSLGVQSFDAAELAVLGRIHSAAQAGDAVACLRRAGIHNLGLDLIYGVPGQTMTSWQASLGRALELAPRHMSCYALSFETGTPMYEDLLAGRVAEMDESLQRELYYAAIEKLTAAGMEHYEISNFAHPGFVCRHNLTYWHNESYLGLGPAAASFVKGIRRTNLPDTRDYLSKIFGNQAPSSSSESLAGRAAMAETLMLGLRLSQGVDISGFKSRFGRTPAEMFPKSINMYLKIGALFATDTHLRITSENLFVSDTILAAILSEV
jgi:oxygen-independent coproporphyrinogen-3 oxidase